MAKKGIRAGNSYKTQYKAYQIRGSWYKNKERKLKSRIKRNPEDTGAVEALKLHQKGDRQPKRANFKGKGWFHPQEQRLLKLLKSDDIKVRIAAKDKLDDLNTVTGRICIPNIHEHVHVSIPDQLYNIGIINEKRRDTAKTRMGRVFKR